MYLQKTTGIVTAKFLQYIIGRSHNCSTYDWNGLINFFFFLIFQIVFLCILNFNYFVQNFVIVSPMDILKEFSEPLLRYFLNIHQFWTKQGYILF